MRRTTLALALDSTRPSEGQVSRFESGQGLHARVAQWQEAAASNPAQCPFESDRAYQLRTACNHWCVQRLLNPYLRWVRSPGGPPFAGIV
jgi:hypothetical protein